MQEYDLIVVGSGTSANGVARRCAREGWKVAVVDERPFGGTCALRGCDPKKMLRAVAEVQDFAARMEGRGPTFSDRAVNWRDAMAHKETFTGPMTGKVESSLQKAGVDLWHGTAEFVEDKLLKVGEERLKTRYVHLAAGARPATLGIPGEELLTTSTEFLRLEALPAHMLFVGGGFISFEFAHIARRAGVEQVTIVHRGEHPLKHFDPDLVALLLERMRDIGIDVHLQTSVAAIKDAGNVLRVLVESGEETREIVCDLAVHGAGRVPDIDDLHCERADIETGPGGIRVNRFMRSVTNPAVFAAGDCADTGEPMKTPIGTNEARIAAKNLIAGKDMYEITYPPSANIVFTIPALARVGRTEQELRKADVDYDAEYAETASWFSSLRVNESCSGFKVLKEKGTGLLLGAHVLGPGAEEQINLFTMAMHAGLTANDIKAMVFAYPSFASDLGYMV